MSVSLPPIAVSRLSPAKRLASRFSHSTRHIGHDLRKFFRSVSVTLTGQAILLVGLFLITRVSAVAFGAAGFGEYQVARRTLAVISFPLMCGIGISMPRYVARVLDKQQELSKWLLAAAALAAVLLSLFAVAGMLWWPQLGEWTFGANGRRELVLALLFAAIGQFCQTLSYSAMRGFSRFRDAAIIQVSCGVAAPLLGIALSKGRVERALMIAGTCWILIGCGSFLSVCWKWALPATSFKEVRRGMGALLVFGAPRIPGEVALFGMFALPAFAAVHRNDIAEAGFLSVGLSLVQALGTAFAATGFVLLPYWSRAAQGRDAKRLAARRVGILIGASALISTVALCGLQLLLKPIAKLLLGPLAGAGLHDLRYVTLGAVPYVTYLVLRDYFDALTVFPLNTVALAVSITLQFFLLRIPGLGISQATACSYCLLGLIMFVLWLASMRWMSRGTVAVPDPEVAPKFSE